MSDCRPSSRLRQLPRKASHLPAAQIHPDSDQLTSSSLLGKGSLRLLLRLEVAGFVSSPTMDRAFHCGEQTSLSLLGSICLLSTARPPVWFAPSKEIGRLYSADLLRCSAARFPIPPPVNKILPRIPGQPAIKRPRPLLFTVAG
jgi:hypothetical protein